jgi:hypothetical protein
MGAAGRLVVILGAIVAAVVLFVVLRGGDGESSPTTQAEPTTSESTTSIGTNPTETSPTTTDAGPGPRRIRLTIPASGPEGVERIEVEQGERVVLVIRSGIADHAHLHGYDLMADVGPGLVGRIRLQATIPGVFELELEERTQQFAELTVSP